MLDFLCHTAACSPPIRAAQLMGTAFLAILFLQSGLDKIVDRRGNLAWLGEHFANSPLGGHVALLLTIVTASEVAAGALSAVGLLVLLVGDTTTLAVAGAVLAGVSLLMLFLGQRLAKDYAGAALLVPYFLLTLFVLFLYAASQ